MSDIYDYLIVGSGCSGAIAAQTLVNAGVNVVMIDVGFTGGASPKLPAGKDFANLRRNDSAQSKYLIGDHGQGISWGKIAKGAQLTPPRQYMVEDVEKLTPMSSKTFSPLESLGYGGLGIGWGLQCWEYSDADLQRVGLDVKRTQQAYNIVGERIGISAAKDDAARYTINELAHFQPPISADRNHQRIQKLYTKKILSFQKQGVYVGRTPLAAITKAKPGRKPYQYLDTDFYSDANKSGWRPWMTIDQLKKKSNFHYRSGLLVTSFKEKGDLVEITALDTSTMHKTSIMCRKLILASGALGSARIVMRSQGSTRTKVPLLSNPHSYVPCVQPKLLGKGYEKRKLGLGQLSYFIDKKGDDSGISVASSYSYQSLMLFRIIKQLPLNFADGRILSQFLTSGLVIMIIQHPDNQSTNKYLKLTKDKKSPTGDRLEAHYELSQNDEKEWEKREKNYVTIMRRLHTFPIRRIKTEHGSAIHYAGTLPFSDTSKPLHLSPSGKLYNTKHVYVADSSGFRFLPAKGLTFTLMANAHIVAENILKEQL